MNAILLALLLICGPQEKKPAAPATVKKMTATLSHDISQQLVYLDADVTLREGALELFLCPRRTKEHESILAADVDPFQFNVAMLIIGAVPGEPVIYEPKFVAAHGQPIKIWIQYDEAGTRKMVDAREWVRDSKTRQALPAQFIYTGSRFVLLPGKERADWLGYSGDLMCISNFPGSVIDVSMRSSDKNNELMFVAWTERIPERATKVKIIIEPLQEDD